MKLKLLFLSFIAIHLTAYSQNQGSISGKVLEKTTNIPIAYASVSIKKNAKIISGGISDDKGNFEIKNIPSKIYVIEIQFIGYKKYTTNVDLAVNNKVNLNTIFLETEATQLEGVTVVAEKSTIEQKIDRKVITVGKDLISSGTTASELMNNIPSVSVDPQTNAISLRGNTNVKVLIDGKPSNIDASQLLQQIPSSSIKQIELITNPSAKYNPEGMSGIINVILNKNSNSGYNGSINSGITFGKTPKANTSLDMSYKVGKVNFYANYGLNSGKNSNHGFINTFDVPGTTSFDESNNQLFSFVNNNTSHLFKLGMDYYLNDKNTISIYTNQNIFIGNGNSTTTVGFPIQPDLSQQPYAMQLYDSHNNNYSQAYNLDFNHKFVKEGHSLELEFNYNNSNNKENSVYYNYQNGAPASTIDPIILNDIKNIGNNLLINLDYTNPISKTIKLEAGLESRIENTHNSFLKDHNFQSDFKYNRAIFSGYTTVSKKWKKWNGQLGMRVEKYNVSASFSNLDNPNTNSNPDLTEIIFADFKDNRLTVYPSGFLNYEMDDTNSFNLSFSRRVDRPSIDQVNPIREWSTPQVTSVGNPNLFPQFTNSYEINYTKKTKIGSITSGIFYRRIFDEISRTVNTDPMDSEKQILTYTNLNDNNAYGVETSANLNFTKWYSANVSLDAYFKKIRGYSDGLFLETNSSSFNARLSNTFKASKNWRLQLFSMYRGQEISLQYTRHPMWKIDTGASYTCLKGNGTITFRVSDIFNTMHFGFSGNVPLPREGAFYWESRSAYIGFMYRFGSGKNKAIDRKKRDDNTTQGGGGLF